MGGVVWLFGPSGVGKSTVGWLVHRLLPAVMFVDADQVGLRNPAPADDPGNRRVKARSLAALDLPDAPLIVSGGVADRATLDRFLRGLDRAPVVRCRLRVGADELRARIAARGGGPLVQLADAADATATEVLHRTGLAP